MKYRNCLILTIMLFVLGACQKENNPNLITKHSIGYLTDSTQVKELKRLFANDSIVNYENDGQFTSSVEDLEIYEKGGNHLLTLTPFKVNDSTSTIKSIKVIDSRFATSNGVSVFSTYLDIRSNYKVSSIQNTIKNVIVVVNEINAHFVIDKEELPSNMRYDMKLKIDPIQIPDKAKIKTFYLHWY